MRTQYTFQMILAVLAFLAGLGCLFFPAVSADLFYWIFTVGIILFACMTVHTAFRKKGLINTAIAAFFVLFASALLFGLLDSLELVMLAFAGYMFLMGLFQGISVVLDFLDHSETTLRDTMGMLLYWTFSALALFFRKGDVSIIIDYFGIYLMIQSLQYFFEVYCFLHPSKQKLLKWQKWIAMPVFFVSFLPGIYLRWMLKKYKNDPLAWNRVKNDKEVNMHVYIHTGLAGEHLVGHMTFSYKNVMYSYGDYDRPAEKLFHTVGPGVLFTVDPEVYVNNCNLYEQDTIFDYGLHLDETQCKLLEEQIDALWPNLYRWHCLLEQSKGGRKNFKEFEQYYADRLWYRTNCTFYKFKTGQWKYYWILDNNCSNFASALLSKIGCQIPMKTGLVSPGEFFEFFETLFEDPDSMVISRSWHDGTVPQTLFDVKQPY